MADATSTDDNAASVRARAPRSRRRPGPRSRITYLEDNPNRNNTDAAFHRMSHGESFLELLRSRFDSPGLYCLDEPEAALSFSAQVALVGVLHDLAARGAQVLCATHSPLLAALPGATILEAGPWGLRPTTYDELKLVGHWRRYLDEPMRYLRHVLDVD